VFRSNRHIYCQVIDDWAGETLASASSLKGEPGEELEHGGNIEAAERVGEEIGEKCLQKGITQVVFDRAGYKYHGRVKAVAEAARAKFEEAGAEGF
jgi:large subunit ribosomal protein L18